MKKLFFVSLLIVLLICACSSKNEPEMSQEIQIEEKYDLMSFVPNKDSKYFIDIYNQTIDITPYVKEIKGSTLILSDDLFTEVLGFKKSSDDVVIKLSKEELPTVVFFDGDNRAVSEDTKYPLSETVKKNNDEWLIPSDALLAFGFEGITISRHNNEIMVEANEKISQ